VAARHPELGGVHHLRVHLSSEKNYRYRTASRYVFFGFVAVAAYFLIEEHRAHLIAVLPYILLAACPLMHLFHHGGTTMAADDSEQESRPPPSGGAPQH
jgi:hypothetical protein